MIATTITNFSKLKFAKVLMSLNCESLFNFIVDLLALISTPDFSTNSIKQASRFLFFVKTFLYVLGS